jgi:hypothetical protein
MKKKSIWYGYLDAGKQSSAVLRDDSLDTANPQSIYLFNLARNAVLEYKREIVEPKLRELKASEKNLAKKLLEAYEQASAEFQPRGGKAVTRYRERPASNDEMMDIDLIDDMDAAEIA